MGGKEFSGNGTTFIGDADFYSSFFVFQLGPKIVISVNQDLDMSLNQDTCSAHVESGLSLSANFQNRNRNHLIGWLD